MNRLVPCLLFLAASALRADAPVATHLFPAGGQRGTTVPFHAAGLNLNQECHVEMTGPGVTVPKTVRRTTSPWFEGPLLELADSQKQENYPRAMAAQATIAATAEPGDRLVFLRTSHGWTAPLKFVVGTLPEIVEAEADGDEPAHEVTVPVTVNGRVFPREDVDAWAVKLQAGQTLFATVDAGRFGSPLEAKITLRDPSGVVAAEAFYKGGRDPKVSVTAKVAGVHTLSITDTRGDGGPSFVYRLTLTDQPPTADPTPAVMATENPDPVRGNVLPVPGVGSGTLSKAGHTDRWSVIAKKDQPLDIELKARSLGSSLLGKLTLTDAAGKELAAAEGGAGDQLDPTVKWTPPADGLYFVTVADQFASRGGPNFGYRLRVTTPAPDFDLTFAVPVLNIVRGANAPLKLSLVRKGTFTAPVKVTFDGLPAGITLPKEVVFAPGQTAIDVPLQSAATATIAPAAVTITGTAQFPKAPFTSFPTIVRRATWKDSPDVNSLRLMVAVPTPFKIAGDYELKLIARGTVYVRKFRIDRKGFAGPIEIDMADNQARHLQGVTGPKITVPGDKSEFEYPLTFPPWMETGRTARACVMGTATVKDIDGSEHVVNYSSREQNDQIIAVVEPERLSLKLDNVTARLSPAGQVAVAFTVRRGIGLAGPVEVSAEFHTESVLCEKVTVADKLEAGRLVFKPKGAVKELTPVAVTVRAVFKDEHGRPVTAEQALTLYLVP